MKPSFPALKLLDLVQDGGPVDYQLKVKVEDFSNCSQFISDPSLPE
jgi:hypothetical protein